jgi:4-amino-4-deoxy-L-arabinose transferase-like glycosyltransferase
MKIKILNINFSNKRELFLWTVLFFGVLVVLSTEILGLFNLLNRTSILILWSCIIGISLINFFIYVESVSVDQYKKNKPQNLTLFLELSLLLILLITIFVAIMYPPNTWDSMTYHMPRVMHWIQNQNVDFYETSNIRQLIMPPFSEYVILHLQLLTKGDYLANLVQWFSMFSSLIVVSLITKEFGGSKNAQLLSAFICATIPMGILQSSSTQTDFVASLWIVMVAYFLIKYLNTNNFKYILGFAVALSLGILTKATTYIFAFPFCVWLFLYIVKKNRTHFFGLLILPAIILLLNFGHFSRNYDLYENLLGTHTENTQITNEKFNFPVTVSNVTRNLSLNFAVPSITVNEKTTDIVIKILERFDLSVNKSVNTYGGEFYIPFSFYESTAPNSIHLFILILVIFLLLLTRKLTRLSCFYLLSIVAGFLLFSIILKWQPYGNRLMLPLFVLLSSFLGFSFVKLESKILSFFFMFLLLIYAMPYLFMNKSRPLVGTLSHNNSGSYTFLAAPVWTSIRNELYFIRRPNLYKSYKEITSKINNNDCESIGLIMGNDDWEYPLWVLVKERIKNDNLKFFNIKASNRSSAKYLKNNINLEPCAIISIANNSLDNKVLFKSTVKKKDNN